VSHHSGVKGSMPMNRLALCSGLAAGVLAFASAAIADPNLVGFVLYRADESGNAINSPFYFYSSNPQIFASRQTLVPAAGPAQATSISFPLLDGSNTFSFSTNEPANPGNFAGVQLYFSDDPTSFNPNVAGVAADLAAYIPVGSSVLNSVAADRLLIDYGNSYGALVAYSGASSFQVGDRIITISALSIDSSPAGSMTLNVTQIPAPAALALFAAAGFGATRRNRARAVKARS
jgi:hypothetical protein